MYRKFNTKKEKVQWLKIRWLQLRKDMPIQIRYNYSHNILEAWKVLDIKKNTRGHHPDLGGTDLPLLYTCPRPLNVKKLQDFHELMSFITPIIHRF